MSENNPKVPEEWTAELLRTLAEGFFPPDKEQAEEEEATERDAA